MSGAYLFFLEVVRASTLCDGVSEITTPTRAALAATVRQFYREDMTRVRKQADMDMKWWAEQKPKRLAEARVRALSTSDILSELAKRSAKKQQ